MNKEIFQNNLNTIYKNCKPAPGFSILVEKEGKRIIDYSQGSFSEYEKEKIVTPNTIYDLASITKIYITAIILELSNEQKIDIFDECKKYIDIFKYSELRIIDLLTHRANFNIRLSYYREKFPSNFDEVIFNIKPPEKREKKVVYENITFIYLGKIIENIEGKKITEVFDFFFKKHGLTQSFLGLINQEKFDSPPTEIIEGIITKNFTHDESARLLGGIAGNSGVFASARDLIKFGNLWLTNTFISNNKVAEYVFKNYGDGENKGQGMGWWMRIPSIGFTKNIYSHTGYTGSLLAINPENKIVVSMVTNRTFYGRKNQNHKLIWNEIYKFLKSGLKSNNRVNH